MRGYIEKTHSTDAEYPPPPPLRVCISVQPEGKSCSISARVVVLPDPPVRVMAYAERENIDLEAGAYTPPLLTSN